MLVVRGFYYKGGRDCVAGPEMDTCQGDKIGCRKDYTYAQLIFDKDAKEVQGE